MPRIQGEWENAFQLQMADTPKQVIHRGRGPLPADIRLHCFTCVLPVQDAAVLPVLTSSLRTKQPESSKCESCLRWHRYIFYLLTSHSGVNSPRKSYTFGVFLEKVQSWILLLTIRISEDFHKVLLHQLMALVNRQDTRVATPTQVWAAG